VLNAAFFDVSISIVRRVYYAFLFVSVGVGIAKNAAAQPQTQNWPQRAGAKIRHPLA
jgi:hypothetical protein